MTTIGTITFDGAGIERNERRPAGGGLLMSWFAVALAASLAPAVLYALLPQAAVPALLDGMGFAGFANVSAALSALLLATAQWLVLRRHAPVSWAWIIASTAATSCISAISLILQPNPVPIGPTLGALLGAALIGGPLIGGAQWLVLRRSLGQAWRWVPAVMLTGALTVVAQIGMAQFALSSETQSGQWALAVIAAAIPALISSQIEGRTLLRLLRRDDAGQ